MRKGKKEKLETAHTRQAQAEAKKRKKEKKMETGRRGTPWCHRRDQWPHTWPASARNRSRSGTRRTFWSWKKNNRRRRASRTYHCFSSLNVLFFTRLTMFTWYFSCLPPPLFLQDHNVRMTVSSVLFFIKWRFPFEISHPPEKQETFMFPILELQMRFCPSLEKISRRFQKFVPIFGKNQFLVRKINLGFRV